MDSRRWWRDPRSSTPLSSLYRPSRVTEGSLVESDYLQQYTVESCTRLGRARRRRGRRMSVLPRLHSLRVEAPACLLPRVLGTVFLLVCCPLPLCLTRMFQLEDGNRPNLESQFLRWKVYTTRCFRPSRSIKPWLTIRNKLKRTFRV